MRIIDAILQINPNAKVIVRGNDLNTCEIEWLESTTPISIEDIKAQILTSKQEILNSETKKASGKQKLLDLGLTESEVKALIGV